MRTSNDPSQGDVQEDLASVAHYLPAFGALVRESCGNVEEASTATISALGGLAFHSRLSAQTLKSIVGGSTEGGAGTRLDECRATLEELRLQLVALPEELSASAQRLRESCQQALTAQKGFSRLRSMARKSRILAMNGRIEAGRAGPSGAGFAVVAEGLGELAEGARSCAEDAVAAATRMQEVDSVAEGLVTLAATFTEQADQLQAQVAEALNGLAQAHSDLELAAIGATINSDEFATGIHAAVTTFQHNDRANQGFAIVADVMDYLLDFIADRLGAEALEEVFRETNEMGASELTSRCENALARLRDLVKPEAEDQEPELF